jgi:phospholipase/carboxylesterase
MDIDWSNPETIDPFRKDIGNFLDLDLSVDWKQAIDAYGNAKDAYYSKNYEEAARYFLVCLRYYIYDAMSIYWLACCYGLLGEAELAAKYLERAVRAGFENIEHIKRDPDFEKVRGKKVFDATVNSMESLIEEKNERLGNIIYIDAPALLKCRIQLPRSYDKEKSYPLVVGLHGYSGNPEVFMEYSWEYFGQPEFIYATPQAPYPLILGPELGYSWAVRGSGDKELYDKARIMSETYITRVVQDLGERYNIDEVYLLGYSQGAFFAYNSGIKNHHLFKGLICFSGWLDTDWIKEKSIKAAKDLRVFIAHGTKDRSVKYEEGIKAKDVLTSYGYDVTFRDFEGGHTVPEEVVKQAVEWMEKK